MHVTRTGAAFECETLGEDRASPRRSLSNRLVYSIGKDPITVTTRDWFNTAAYAVRERLIEHWMETMRSYYRSDAKRVYYLSMEFLTGRLLSNSLLNMGCHDECRQALADLEVQLDELCEMEQDAALGNGGLGRLAACFLDSMATLSLPGYGYGIRYEYGLFKQRIEQGSQVEYPDNWLRYGNPWEFPRPEVLFPVRFGGHVTQFTDERGDLRSHWVDAEEVMAMAFDTPVPGYGTGTVNNMRLWSAKASHDFNLKYFNEGNYLKAVEEKNESENLSKVLYPDDSTDSGRALRLKQQYFFVCASLQDILRRFLNYHSNLVDFPEKVAIQLNDTHPSIGIPELMRVLLDVHRLEWEPAWDITRRTFSYTNHTLMPEALETWPVALVEQILPRHLQIIYEINCRLLEQVRHRYPGEVDRLRRMSIVDEERGRRVRMAHLAMAGCHRVNGASQAHTDLMRRTIFADFDCLFPGLIVNVTNGITPRRWLHQGGDRFFVLADHESYAACQEQVDALYGDPDEWTRRAILNIASPPGRPFRLARRLAQPDDEGSVCGNVELDVAIGMLRDVLTQSTCRALVFWLVCVLLCVPSLKRAVERTPINKDTPGFKFSKTLELSHKRASSTLVVATRTEPVAHDVNICECPAQRHDSHVAHDLAVRPTPSRAPPLTEAI